MFFFFIYRTSCFSLDIIFQVYSISFKDLRSRQSTFYTCSSMACFDFFWSFASFFSLGALRIVIEFSSLLGLTVARQGNRYSLLIEQQGIDFEHFLSDFCESYQQLQAQRGLLKISNFYGLLDLSLFPRMSWLNLKCLYDFKLGSLADQILLFLQIQVCQIRSLPELFLYRRYGKKGEDSLSLENSKKSISFFLIINSITLDGFLILLTFSSFRVYFGLIFQFDNPLRIQISSLMKSSVFKDEPVLLASFDYLTKSYVLNEAALAILTQVPQPLALIAVAGMYRTGKSYLLNKIILNKAGGFGVGPTVNPCTKGLWIWGRPILCKTKNQETVNAIIIDSEGIGACQQDATHDTKIFALTMLLSSNFIFNSVGAIDQQSIQSLQLIVNLSKVMRLKANQTLSSNDCKTFFPNLCWVLRDFSLELVTKKGSQISAQQYLQSALQPNKSDQKNKIRQTIINYFANRECVTLVRPVMDEQTLQHLDKLELSQLRPEFLEQSINFRKRLMNSIRIKQIGGKRVSGQMLAELSKAYIKSINEGTIPVIQNTWSMLCKNQCLQALASSQQLLDQMIKQDFNKRLPLSQSELKNAQTHLKKVCLTNFNKKTMDNQFYQQFAKDLKSRINQRLNTLRSINDQEVVKFCQAISASDLSAFDRKLRNHQFKSAQENLKELRTLHQSLQKKCEIKGSRSKQFILEQLYQKAMQSVQGMSRKLLQQRQQLKVTKDQLQLKLLTQLKEQTQQSNREKEQLKSKLNLINKAKLEAEQEKQQMMVRYQELQRQSINSKNALQKDYQQQLSSLMDNNVSLKNKLLTIDSARSCLQNQKSQLLASQMRLKNLIQKKEQQSMRNIQQFKQKQRRLLEQIKHKESEFESDRTCIEQNFFREKGQLRSKLNQSTQKVVILQTQKQNIVRQLEVAKLEITKSNQKYHDLLNTRNKQFQELSRTIRELQSQLHQQQENSLQTQATQVENIKIQFQSQLQSVKSDSKSAISKIQHEKALMNQQLGFKQEQILSFKERLQSQIKRAQQFEQIAGQRDNQILNLNKLCQQMRNSSQQEIQLLLNEKLVLERQVSQLKIKEQSLSQRQTQLQHIKFLYQGLLKELKQGQSSSANLITQLQTKYQQSINSLNTEIQTIKQQQRLQLQRLKLQCQQEICHYRNLFSIQKQELEKNLLQEKMRFQEQLTDAEQSIRIEKRDLNNYLQSELQKNTNRYQQLLEKYRHQAQSLIAKLESLGRQKETLKKLLDSHQYQSKQLISQLTNSLKQAQESHQADLQSFQSQKNLNLNLLRSKAQEISHLQLLQQQLEANLHKKQTIIKNLQTQGQHLNAQFQQRYKKLNQQLCQRQQKIMSDLSLYSKQRSSLEQKNLLLQKRISDLESQKNLLSVRSEQKFKALRDQAIVTLNSRILSLEGELNDQHAKYQAVRAKLKEVQTNSLKSGTALQRQNSILVQKISMLQEQIADQEQRYQRDSNLFRAAKQSAVNEWLVEKKAMSIEMSKLKAASQNADQLRSQAEANLQRERLLWQDKFKYLQNQLQLVKSQQSQSSRKWQGVLSQLQRGRKGQQQRAFQSLVQSIQRKYKSQIQHLKEVTNKKIEELQLKNSRLVQAKTKESYTDPLLLIQLSNLRQEKDKLHMRYQQDLSQITESSRKRLGQVESMLKQSEQKLRMSKFEKQRDSARLRVQNQRLIRQLEQFRSKEKLKTRVLNEDNKTKYGQIIKRKGAESRQ